MGEWEREWSIVGDHKIVIPMAPPGLEINYTQCSL